MIPKFLPITHCPICNKSLNWISHNCICFHPFKLSYYPHINEYGFINQNDEKFYLEFMLKSNHTLLNNTTTNLFDNASSIQDLISIYHKLNIFQ